MLFTWTLGIVIYIYNRWFVYIAAFVDRWLVWQFLWSVDIFWDVSIGRMASDVIYFCGKLMDLCFRGYDKQLLTLSVSCRFGLWFFWSLNMSFVFEKRKRKKLGVIIMLNFLSLGEIKKLTYLVWPKICFGVLNG